ncbi:hypothetical protein H7H82_06800 [Mycobacterium heidelbergense]|uniref:Uncharacterized protein n=1 Tax=Mycobacterium heidelbergense TaxID=53376 RepID=A0A1X0D7K6_MYCHE|nr:hypothetical protein [Mycobacterium heidelbergense]MCV7050311.1 hypothetical protein [Mycobacterium heidelbergense]ORA67720.1 hypothetical protein BST25_22490 [Mycobacterium heidelbergense]
MTEYKAIVTRSDPGWSIYVPEVDRHTYAAHLREIESMARDLVQVMTDLPLEDITVAVQLPPDLADAIAAMRNARDGLTAAETAARTAQQTAAAALRKVGAPLRDIALTLGVSHQRVHQVLEEADERSRQLEQFRREVDLNLERGALVDFELPVTGDDGGFPIVVVFADEPVSTLTAHIQAAGGYANVFVKDSRGVVHFVSVIEEACAIGDPGDRMVGDEAPGATSTVGMLLAYVERHPNGVTISAALGHPACARDARKVEFQPS